MNSQIYEEASAWIVDFRTGESAAPVRRRFERWLGASPQHVRAYLELTALWEDAGCSLDNGRALDIDALVAGARAETNVIALQGTSVASLPAQPVVRRARAYGLAATIAVVVLGGAIAVWFGLPHNPVYATEVGEQRSIRLEDGSTLELNARSRIRVRYSVRAREVELLAGQALFRVAQVANRPFTVTSGQTRVRAVGTQFDVYRKRSGTVVTVLEGRVAILAPRRPAVESAASANAPTLELAAGEQATVVPVEGPRRTHGNPAVATAWTQHRLVFESAPIAEVAEEFNRYNTQQLSVEGPGLEDFHVSGTFAASDPATLPRFLKFLREQPGVRVTESGDRIVVNKK